MTWWDRRISPGMIKRLDVQLEAKEREWRASTFIHRRNLHRATTGRCVRPGAALLEDRYFTPRRRFEVEHAAELAAQAAALALQHRVVPTLQSPYTTDDEELWAEPPAQPAPRTDGAGPSGTAHEDGAGPSAAAPEYVAGPSGPPPPTERERVMSPTGSLPGTLAMPAGSLQAATSDEEEYQIRMTLPSTHGSAGGYLTISPLRGELRISTPPRAQAGPPLTHRIPAVHIRPPPSAVLPRGSVGPSSMGMPTRLSPGPPPGMPAAVRPRLQYAPPTRPLDEIDRYMLYNVVAWQRAQIQTARGQNAANLALRPEAHDRIDRFIQRGYQFDPNDYESDDPNAGGPSTAGPGRGGEGPA